jgi:hypothetical protein
MKKKYLINVAMNSRNHRYQYLKTLEMCTLIYSHSGKHIFQNITCLWAAGGVLRC